MTPRKPKQRQQHSRPNPSLIPASDYESDVQNYAQIPNLPPPTRSNTELNLSVLRRYNPSILTILSIAANAVIYKFTPSNQQWEKSGVEGALFVCEQGPPTKDVDAGYCVVVLNRHGMENLILDLAKAQDIEIAPELLIIRSQEDETQKVMGIWIHEDKDGTREINARLIQQCWDKVNSTRTQRSAVGGEPAASNGFSNAANISAVGTGPSAGRRISLTDLFGQRGSS